MSATPYTHEEIEKMRARSEFIGAYFQQSGPEARRTELRWLATLDAKIAELIKAADRLRAYFGDTDDADVLAYDAARGRGEEECCRVVSKEDAEVAAAVREIEAEGLTAILTRHDREGFPNLWEVGRWTLRNDGEPRGEAATLPAALKAYRRAKEATP